MGMLYRTSKSRFPESPFSPVARFLTTFKTQLAIFAVMAVSLNCLFQIGGSGRRRLGVQAEQITVRIRSTGSDQVLALMFENVTVLRQADLQCKYEAREGEGCALKMWNASKQSTPVSINMANCSKLSKVAVAEKIARFMLGTPFNMADLPMRAANNQSVRVRNIGNTFKTFSKPVFLKIILDLVK